MGKEKTNTTSVKQEIQKAILILVIISLVTVGGISCYLNYFSAISILEDGMQTTAEQAAQQIKSKILGTMGQVEVIGSIPRLSDPDVDIDEKLDMVITYRENHDWESITIVDENGSGIFSNDLYVGDNDAFQKAMAGEANITDPMFDSETDEFIVAIVAPLWEDGKINTKTIGAVIITVDASGYSQLMSTIKVSQGATAYLINGNGDCIAHPNFDLVLDGHNSSEAGKTDASMKQLGELETKLINGESGFGNYKFEGQSKFLAYTPVGVNGWGLAVGAPLTDFIGNTILGIVITAVMLLLAIILSIIISRRIGNAIGNPIKQCAHRLQLLAEGDLETAVEEVNTKDETSILVDSTKSIVDSLQNIIGDAGYILEEMAEGNFTVNTRIGDAAYVGSFQRLILSMKKLNRDLDETLNEIHEASEQVETGATQMAESAQGLAEGATEQAGSVQELFATVHEVVDYVKNNADAANEASEKVTIVAREAEVSQGKMNELTDAMKKIEDTSKEINNIIVGIEDIASQTNLLSLNAAIEAARAGEAGKGFAVVADQIRTLADQSAESAVDTRKLIEASILEVNNGGNITRETAEYLNRVMLGLEDIAEAVDHTKKASEKQEVAMGEIETGVGEISQVVENNSAAAEETSATSEELSAQSENLNSLVNRFKLQSLNN